MKKNTDRYFPAFARTRDHLCYRLEGIHFENGGDQPNEFILGFESVIEPQVVQRLTGIVLALVHSFVKYGKGTTSPKKNLNNINLDKNIVWKHSPQRSEMDQTDQWRPGK